MLSDEQRPRMLCGRVVTADPALCRQAQFQGRVVYFCTEFCQDAFYADPVRFYAAHSAVRGAAPNREGDQASG